MERNSFIVDLCPGMFLLLRLFRLYILSCKSVYEWRRLNDFMAARLLCTFSIQRREQWVLHMQYVPLHFIANRSEVIDS
jgi:hypothetical protein